MTAPTSAVTDDDYPDSPPATPLPGSALVPVQRATITDKITYAKHLAKSGLLPAVFRGRPENVLYVVEYGDMLGLSPMAALTGIHVIEGKPTASSALMSALVRRAGHRLRVTGDDTRAAVQITRSDDPDFVFESVWTLDRARNAALAGKDVWKKYPAAMLKARAISECARDACEEALLGMHYTPEELGAAVDEDGNPTAVRATTEVVGRDATLTPITGEPDWTALTTAAEHAQDRGRLGDLWRLAKLTEPRNEHLHAAIAAAGQRVAASLTERDAGQAQTGGGGGEVDAEIINDAPAEPGPAGAGTPEHVARGAYTRVGQVLHAADPDRVREATAGMTDAEATLDVLEILNQDDRECLGVDAAAGPLTLRGLTERVAAYTDRHGRSVRDPLDDGNPGTGGGV